jgi:hypothetical protein
MNFSELDARNTKLTPPNSLSVEPDFFVGRRNDFKSYLPAMPGVSAAQVSSRRLLRIVIDRSNVSSS